MRTITSVFLRNLHFFKSSWIVLNISVSKIQHLIETIMIKCPFWIAVLILRIQVIVIFKKFTYRPRSNCINGWHALRERCTTVDAQCG